MKLPNWADTVFIYAAMVVPPVLMYLSPNYFLPFWVSGVVVSVLLGVGKVLWDWRLDPRKDPETGSGCFTLLLGSSLFSWLMVYAMVSGWIEDRRRRSASEDGRSD